MALNKRMRGFWGEDKAVDFLKKKGYIIIERNYRDKSGEIDIIARDHDELVFVEVKVLGSYGREELERMIGRRKQIRIRNAALRFLTERNGQSEQKARCDVIAVVPEKEGIYHIENAF